MVVPCLPEPRGVVRAIFVAGQVLRREIRQCNESPIRAEILELRFWNKLLGELNDDVLLEGVKARRARIQAELEPKKQRLQSIDEEIEQETRRIHKLMSAFSKCKNEILSAEYEQSLQEAARHKKSLLEESRLVKDASEQITLSEEDETAIIETVRTVRRKVQGGGKPNFAQKR